MILAHHTDYLCEKVKAWATHKNAGKTNKNNPMDFVHGRGNGKEEVGLRPTTRWGRKAPDPMGGFTAYKTRHNLDSYK